MQLMTGQLRGVYSFTTYTACGGQSVQHEVNDAKRSEKQERLRPAVSPDVATNQTKPGQSV
jgi:hypothetical protein